MNVAGEGLQTDEERYAWHLRALSTRPRTSDYVVSPEGPPPPQPISTKNYCGPILTRILTGEIRTWQENTTVFSLNYFCTILSIFISKMLLISNINGDKTQLNYHFCIFFFKCLRKKWFVTLLVYGMISSFNFFWIHVRITVIVS